MTLDIDPSTPAGRSQNHSIVRSSLKSREGSVPMSAMVIFGLIASVALLAAFALLNFDKLTPDHYTYQVLNFVGAGFLTASAADPFNIGVFWTELIWSLLGLYGIIKIWLNRRKAQVDSDATA